MQAGNLVTILKVINSAGGIVASRVYDAYGATTASTKTLLEPFGYTGAYTDNGSGLTRLGRGTTTPASAASPRPTPRPTPTTRIRPAPIPYAGDDPVNNSDPTGTIGLADWIGITVVTAAAAVVGSAVGLAIYPGVGTAIGAAVAGSCVFGGLFEEVKSPNGSFGHGCAEGLLAVPAAVLGLGAYSIFSGES